MVYIEKRQLPSEELNGQSGQNPSSNRQEHSSPTIPTIQSPRESPVGYKSRRPWWSAPPLRTGVDQVFPQFAPRACCAQTLL